MNARLLTLKLRNERDVVAARQRSRQIAKLLQYDVQDQTRIATAVSEIARNAFRYAGGGSVEFALSDNLQIHVVDEGPGIADLEGILNGRYRSATGMGLGIVGAQKLMDAFRIESAAGKGTQVRMSKALPRRAPNPTAADVNRIAAELAKGGEDLYEEVEDQNRALLQTLSELKTRQEELAQLNRELEDTNRGVVALYGELDEKAEHLKQANRLKSTFLSHMSHEFRTPLNSIMALAKILLDRLDGPLTEEQQKQVSFIHNAARELTDMVNDLLDLAKVEAGKIDVHASEFEIATLLGALRGMMRPLNTNPNVQLVFEDVPASVPTMSSDEGKVSQILRNFVSNALKFTERGEVRVCCTYDGKSDVVIITVSDTGIGIPPEEQDRIFQHYYQVDSAKQRQVKGTGLGLPLSRKLAELLGGSVSLRSEPGVGSAFSVRLPVRSPIGDPLPGASRPARQRGEKPRVLLIDDEDVARYLVRKQLAAMDIDLAEARTAAEGLARASAGGFDAIVLDLVMPDATGFYVLSQLKDNRATRDVPVVVHTSRTLAPDEREALSQAVMIVSKARSEPHLRDAIASVLDRAR
jgi:signal transduction histidine kinase/CheY-like chemotaxis protein